RDAHGRAVPCDQRSERRRTRCRGRFPVPPHRRRDGNLDRRRVAAVRRRTRRSVRVELAGRRRRQRRCRADRRRGSGRASRDAPRGALRRGPCCSARRRPVRACGGRPDRRRSSGLHDGANTMTLFEPTVAPVDDLGARRTGHLPTPTKTRFMPLRAGVLNVWEYDDQQFWFADGRLLLRGRNEAGKSKVLELLFPFVLDGDMSPKKLDPFDTANKSMWWNMIGFHKERTVAIGYLWIEFGRLDEAGVADYQTVIVGLQATRAERKVVPWFAITPQRIDVDLDLAPGRVCRTQESFTKALTPEARYATKAVVHRANVGSRLFAMSPERFDNLLHLLRQLRKPKLADKLDNKKLSSVLTDALPPLDESRIEPLATGFGFLDVYRAYARTQVRQRADVLRTAVTRFDDVTREERDNTRALEAAQQATARLTEEAAKLARQLATATGSLSGLDLSKVESLRALEHL